MGQTKKHAKGRLDKWYKLAKERGYRARAAFKLIQLNRKYGFLENSKVLIDLCASPGSWCQVAAETMPVGSLIVGCDLSPIKPISKVITFQSDITTEKCRATLRQHLKSWKADVVLHDGAPNVGTAWVQDAYDQAKLVLESLRLATEFLIDGGTFVTKVFRSKDYNPLLWIFNQLFDKVEATKPPSSRNVSAEIFVVCRGFKAPKRIDPRFLDPKAVFAELAAPTPNNEAKVYKPEVKKRKRDGYEEGEYLQFKELPASEFIQTTDPIAILANYNRLNFFQPPNGDVALAALDKLPETTSDIRISCNDLKVLGRKEFKTLLRWRLRVRDLFGLSTKNTATIIGEVATEVAEVESMDEEMKIQHDLEALRDKDNAKKKREKRKENERRQKEIVRMQMNMTAPLDIGKEQVRPDGEGAMFGLGSVVENQAVNKISRGKMAVPKPAELKKDTDSGTGLLGLEDDEDGSSNNDDDGDQLERDLDNLYENFKERKAEVDAKYRAKKARQEHDDEWDGLSMSDNAESEDSFDLDEDNSDDSDDDNDAPGQKGLTDLMGDIGLSEKAQSFFEQDVFKVIPGLEDIDILDLPTPTDTGREACTDVDMATSQAPSRLKSTDLSDDEGIPVTARDNVRNGKEEDEWQDEPYQHAKGPIDIDVVTAEAMTLAHQLASGQKNRQAALDDGFNKFAFRDRDGLPDWFLDDESRHDKPHKPITKAAALAIKEKLRALNSRPIKKVREAKARKKFKMAQKLEKLRKKSDMLVNEEGMTEKEKADSITRLLSRAGRQKPKQTRQLIIARGPNKGVKGRPSGVAKGRRYKLVDARMKKELRAQKTLNKKGKR